MRPAQFLTGTAVVVLASLPLPAAVVIHSQTFAPREIYAGHDNLEISPA